MQKYIFFNIQTLFDDFLDGEKLYATYRSPLLRPRHRRADFAPDAGALQRRWLPPQPRHLFRHGGAGAEGHRRGAEITGATAPFTPDGLFRAPFPNGGSGKFANREDSVASVNAPSPVKIFQKSSPPSRNAALQYISLFLQSAIFIAKTATSIAKIVVFMYLIFNELNVVFPWFV